MEACAIHAVDTKVVVTGCVVFKLLFNDNERAA